MCEDRPLLEHEIDTVPGAPPPARSVIRLSPADLDEVRTQLADFEERGLIEPTL
jgi:hypothetical protein